jgi:hypothetical protein
VCLSIFVVSVILVANLRANDVTKQRPSDVVLRQLSVYSISRGASIRDSLWRSGADFDVVSVSTMIHQPNRIREEVSSVALLKK